MSELNIEYEKSTGTYLASEDFLPIKDPYLQLRRYMNDDLLKVSEIETKDNADGPTYNLIGLI